MTDYSFMEIAIVTVLAAIAGYLFSGMVHRNYYKPHTRYNGRWIFEQTVFHCTHPDISAISLFGSLSKNKGHRIHARVIHKTGFQKDFTFDVQENSKGEWTLREEDIIEVLFNQAEIYLDGLPPSKTENPVL